MSRFIGLDVHRDFCEVAISDGGPARAAGRVAARREQLELFAGSLVPTDRVVLEATGNALAIARILQGHVAEVVLAHPKRLRAISHAKIKTDKFDARVLAELLAAGLVPVVWVPDERTRALRRLIARRRAVVKRRTQVKNEAQRSCTATSSSVRRSPTCSAPRAARGWRRLRWPTTSSSRSTGRCASWTSSTGRSAALTARSPGGSSAIPTCGG